MKTLLPALIQNFDVSWALVNKVFMVCKNLKVLCTEEDCHMWQSKHLTSFEG